MHANERAHARRVGDWILDRDDGHGIWCHRASAPEVEGRMEIRRLGLVSMRHVEREVAVLETCRHPGIPRVLDVGADRSRRVAWRVVEARYDLTLADRMHAGPLPWDEAARRFLHLADALAYLHRAGLTHGRIEPAWIGLCRDGRTSFTSLSTVRARTDRSASADVYAFGRALFEALTGGSCLPVRVRVGPGEAEPPPIRLDPGPAFPEWLCTLVRRSTEPDPRQRLPNGEAVLGWLEVAAPAFSEDAPTKPTDPVPPPRLLVPRPRIAPAPADAAMPSAWLSRVLQWGRATFAAVGA